MNGVEAFLQQHRHGQNAYYREFAPSRDVVLYVACTWLHVVGTVGPAAPVPIIPDGCADILTIGAGMPLVAGPATKTHWAELEAGVVITGVRLRPGAARAVFGCSAAELVDRDCDLGALAPGIPLLSAELAAAIDLPTRFLVIERWIRSRLERSRPRDAVVIRAAHLLLHAPEHPVGSLAREIGWTTRMLHREFQACCGYGPKFLQRVLRLQGAVRQAHDQRDPPNLPQLAVSRCYADQAHMTRDFRSITGFTPRTYLKFSTSEVGRWMEPGFLNQCPKHTIADQARLLDRLQDTWEDKR